MNNKTKTLLLWLSAVAICLAVIAASVLLYYGHVPSHQLKGELAAPEQVSFLAIGDQGSGQIPQRRVAEAMADEARADRNVLFCVLLGDNFYGDGVQSTDDWQWRWKFESVYSDEALTRLPFFAVLGNHDYLGKVDAQIDYSRMQLGSNRFRLHERQYVRDFGRVGDRPLIRMAFVDTNDVANRYEAAREFVAKAFASETQSPVWRVVVAHHPIRSFGRYRTNKEPQQSLLPALKSAGVDLYLAGHDHNLQLIIPPGEPVVAVSGGGGAGLYAQTENDSMLKYFNEAHGFLKVDVTKEQIQLRFQPIGHEMPYIYALRKP